MSELATIARPYANALYDVSKENSLNFSSTLESLLGIVSDKDFVVYSNNPSTSNKVITKFLTELVDEKNLEFVNFIKVLTENSRLDVLSEILSQYVTLMNSKNGIENIKIVTAYKLSAQDLSNVIRKLEVKYKTKFQPEIVIDPALLGGVKIIIGDQVLDGSVKSRIDRLKSSLLT